MATDETHRLSGKRIVIPLVIVVTIIGAVFVAIQLSGRGSASRNYLILHYTAGLRDLDGGYYASAVKNLTPVVEADANPNAHGFRGEAFLQMKKFEEAEADFRRAIVRQPDLPANHAGLGIALASQGRAKEARPHLDRAAEMLRESSKTTPGEVRRTGDSLESVIEWQRRVNKALGEHGPRDQMPPAVP